MVRQRVSILVVDRHVVVHWLQGKLLIRWKKEVESYLDPSISFRSTWTSQISMQSGVLSSCRLAPNASHARPTEDWTAPKVEKYLASRRDVSIIRVRYNLPYLLVVSFSAVRDYWISSVQSSRGLRQHDLLLSGPTKSLSDNSSLPTGYPRAGRIFP